MPSEVSVSTIILLFILGVALWLTLNTIFMAMFANRITSVIKNAMIRRHGHDYNTKDISGLDEFLINLSIWTISSAAGGIVFGGAIWLAQMNNNYGFLNAPVVSALSCLGLGFISYSVRCRARFTYGLVEIIIGMISSFLAASSDPVVWILQFSAGLYIIVRGFDNIEKSLRDNPASHERWKRIFGRQV